jgi:hypothetical protein
MGLTMSMISLAIRMMVRHLSINSPDHLFFFFILTRS